MMISPGEDRSGLHELTLTSLMMALILVGTIVLRIPIPLTQGYVHLGDAMIYLGVLALRKRDSAIAAGLGSAMGDVLGGFAMWAPWTLVIKAAMAFLTATLLSASGDSRLKAMASMAAGGLLMTAGYYLAETVMYGNPAAALLGIPWNIGQFAAGMVIALALNEVFKKIPRQ